MAGGLMNDQINYDLLPINRLPAQERYLRDPQYNALVDMFYHQLLSGGYTPTELREAVILAATKFEMYHTRHMIFGSDKQVFIPHSGPNAGKE